MLGSFCQYRPIQTSAKAQTKRELIQTNRMHTTDNEKKPLGVEKNQEMKRTLSVEIYHNCRFHVHYNR
ncbi:unnamed protein product [Camellia sinensis]